MDSAVADSPAHSVGREIAGRYQLEELLGEGGMGSVYRAFDSLLEEPVALKLLRPDMMGETDILERFRREVKLARRVTHPNVARVFDLGADAGEHFITMELVEGMPLSRLIEEEAPLGAARVVAIARDICAGLQAAHRAGVVHRDLKPDNMMLTTDGGVSLTDFGVARALDSKQFPTMTVGTLGTPHYMAPEQVALNKTDARTDIYALGVVLFEMCTGGLPWDGDSVYVVAAARLGQEPPDPRERAAVDDALAEIILRCMARRPEDRFHSAAAVGEALASAVSGLQPAVASAPGSPPLPTAWRTTSSASVAVFACSEDIYAAGFCALIESALHGIARLLVRPAYSVPQAQDAREAGRALRTDAVADIAVRDSGDGLRVIVRLLDTRQGVTRLADRFDVSLAELVVSASRIAAVLASGLGCGAPRPLPPGLADERAGRLFLEARHDQLQLHDAGNDRAIAKFERALGRLPSDPYIHGAYAEALVRRLQLEQAFSGDAEEAREMAGRALAQAPQLASARLALAGALMEEGDPAGAAQQLALARQLRPSFAELHALLGKVLALGGKLRRAELEFAHALDTGAVRVTLFDRALALALDGRGEEAQLLLDEQGGDMRRLARYWITQGRLELYRGNRQLSAELLREANETITVARGEALTFLAPVSGAGSVALACETFYAAAADINCSPRRAVAFLQLAAELQAAHRSNDEAVRSIERALEAGLADSAWLQRCPLFKPLRLRADFRAAAHSVEQRSRHILDALRPSSVPTRS